ncbi:DgyrCDS7779 [Dimorphilus gyrociliatus]|uniref:DgyrCDS7779 n=1 Tax=Dimorphilus gyrociliatus TaxID=2664684 RepID=A0A7I8VS72_9ANNE|nr:DgyrCDS7779 [Dimorphilus gyrociliatus]
MEQRLPITKIGIIEDKQKCPPDYDVLFYSSDRNEECDLMPDGFFKKSKRHLCITKQQAGFGQMNMVLADIAVQNDRERPPNGYSIIEYTMDTKEKATKKKQICVKVIPREATSAAICDICLLTKSKRAPVGYTLAGEINNVAICFKICELPPIQVTQTQSPTLPASLPTTNVKEELPMRQNDLQQASSSTAVYHPLSGVQFVLNAAFSSPLGLKSVYPPDIQSRTLVDINNEYQYPFAAERTALQI